MGCTGWFRGISWLIIDVDIPSPKVRIQTSPDKHSFFGGKVVFHPTVGKGFLTLKDTSMFHLDFKYHFLIIAPMIN